MPCSASFCSTVPAIFDLVVQKFIRPGRLMPEPGAPCFAHHAATCKQPVGWLDAWGELHFPEAGQEVQRGGATLRETAAVATQWNGH
jgi:hypothetical protein